MNVNVKQYPSVYYGWFAIFGGMVAVLAHGATFTVGNYALTSMVTEGAVSATIPGYCNSLMNLCSILFAAPVCGMMQKIGHRTTLLLGTALSLSAFIVLMLGFANDLLVLALYLPVGFGFVTGCKVGSPHLVSSWFKERQSIPMTLMIGAAPLSAFFVTMGASHIAQSDWRAGWQIMVSLCIAAGIAEWLLVRDDVKAKGEVIDGRYWREKHGLPTNLPAPLEKESSSRREVAALLKDAKFMLFNAGALLRMGAYYCCSGYISLLIISKGYVQEESVTAVMALTIGSLFGSFTAPVWEKLHASSFKQNILANLLMALGTFLLFKGDSLLFLNAATFILGYSYGLGRVSQTLVLTEVFGQFDFTSAFSLHTSIINLCFIFPALFGLIASKWQDYGIQFLLLSVLNLSFVFVFLYIGKNHIGKRAKI